MFLSSISFWSIFNRLFITLFKDVSKYGRETSGRFLLVGIQQEYENMVLISFEDRSKILIFPKFQGYSSKIVPAMPNWILKFYWMQQVQTSI